MRVSVTNCRSTFVTQLGIACNLELLRDLKSHKNIISMSLTKICFLCTFIGKHPISKQSVLTLISPVSSIGIRDNNNIYITLTMIIYEDMKSIAHVLLHPICVLSHLMYESNHCNKKLFLCY